MYQLGKGEIIGGFGDDGRSEGMHREGITDVHVGRIGGDRVVREDVKVVDILST